jgi:hypothetical protein
MWSRIRSTMAMTLLLIATNASAQQRFKSPDDAVAALVNAAKGTDRAAVMRLLGPGSSEIVSSGDAVADATARKRVLEAYDSRHQVVMEGADKAVLVIGNEDCRSRSRSCARTAAGASILPPVARKSSFAASGATS